MGVTRETQRIQTDGQIAAYLCAADNSALFPPHGMMDHYSSLCINTNMLLNLATKPKKKLSKEVKVPFFKATVRSMSECLVIKLDMNKEH